MPLCLESSQPQLWMPQPAMMVTSQFSPDEEVVVDQILNAALGDDHRDKGLFIHRSIGNMDINAGLIRLLRDLNMVGGLPLLPLAVQPEVIGPIRGCSSGRQSSPAWRRLRGCNVRS